METNPKISRKDQILQALARMLETEPGKRITTAALAQEVGVSEAALYRHVPSKAKMFEGLIRFIEDTLFQRITRILNEEPLSAARCEKILLLLLTFCVRNPGLTRLLVGDALAGETDRLRERIAQFFARIEAQLKQILREAQIRENLATTLPPGQLANLLLAAAEGRLVQFVRSEFRESPLDNWEAQWQFLSRNLFEPYTAPADDSGTTPASN